MAADIRCLGPDAAEPQASLIENCLDLTYIKAARDAATEQWQELEKKQKSGIWFKSPYVCKITSICGPRTNCHLHLSCGLEGSGCGYQRHFRSGLPPTQTETKCRQLRNLERMMKK
jgi:hypothetical protein